MSAIEVVSANLPVLRELCGRIGQQELAERVGVSRRTVARLEKGEVADPGLELMNRIAGELRVSLEVLTKRRVHAMPLALPDDVCKRLRSKDGPQVLDAMIRAARG